MKRTLNWLYKRIMFVLSILKLSSCPIELQTVSEMLMNSVWTLCLSVVPIDFQDGVNDFDGGVNKSVFFSFVCRMTHMNAQKCYWMLIKVQNWWLNMIYAKKFVFSRLWMYLRTIGRRFTQMIAYILVMNSKRCNQDTWQECTLL